MFPEEGAIREGSLRRMLGPATTLFIGLGIAIGSGIFRTPGIVAGALGSPFWMLSAWTVGGLFILASGLVSAELATRFPRAGGEYVFLREAYGRFAAFFFGWGYTVFIIGGGAATIAAAVGEAASELIGFDSSLAPAVGAISIAAITAINAIGLRAGAGLQDALTALKVIALVGIGAVAFAGGEARTDFTLLPTEGPRGMGVFAAALIPVLWAYEGTTDSIKMAEEIRDVKRDLPRALVLSAITLTLLYVLINAAFLCVLTPEEMARSRFVANDAMAVMFGPGGAAVMAGLSVLVLLGALSSTILATVRVTFALARDGLSFRFMALMSRGQAPVPALFVVGGIAILFTLFRGFQQILNIYFLASAVLFGLSYGSLIVFRVRDRRLGAEFPAHAFRCPMGPLLASLLIAFEVVLAVRVVLDAPMDSLYTLLLLAIFAGLFAVWRVNPRGRERASALLRRHR